MTEELKKDDSELICKIYLLLKVLSTAEENILFERALKTKPTDGLIYSFEPMYGLSIYCTLKGVNEAKLREMLTKECLRLLKGLDKVLAIPTFKTVSSLDIGEANGGSY